MNVDGPQAWVGKLGKVWLRANMWVQALAFLLLQDNLRHSTWIRTLPTRVRVFESSVLASGPTLGVHKILRKWGCPGGNRWLEGRLSEVLLVLWLLACSLLLPWWKQLSFVICVYVCNDSVYSSTTPGKQNPFFRFIRFASALGPTLTHAKFRTVTRPA